MTRSGRTFNMAAALFVATLVCSGPVAAQSELDVTVDQATIIKLPEQVTTIVVGNPLIADVSLQTGGMLVVTGKGYGSTNIVALNRAGEALLEKTVRVSGPSSNVVVVYRGAQRETYSCQPNCEQRITLGDSATYFGATIGQTSMRNVQAQAPLPQSR